MRKEKVLVTGANGLLGANVIKTLAGKGYNAIAMVREGCNMRGLSDLNHELVYGNITNKNHLEEQIKRCDYVIHCAARTKQVPNKIEAFTEANIKSTEHIINLCNKYNIKRLVFVSTANCFTNGTIDKPGDEKSNFMPWLEGSGYAYSKYIAQNMVTKAAENNKINAITVAPTFMIGERDAGPSSGALLLYGLKKRVVFYPPGGKSFIDVDSAAEAVVNALTMGKSGNKYMLSGTNLTYKDFFKTVAEHNNKRKLLIPIPGALLKVVALISDILENITGASLALNSVNRKLLCLDNYFSNSKAVKELSLKHTNINSSINKAINWYKQNRYL
ncbi:MAG: NAD-dependent epimerase/dehydratase family protein [Bacteroidales bacterium]|jgi:dihydroflavonol-4-reductase|nr:NAD-dependent epimerase/dehydratase family protein [Bacteroidales bacterium]